jgi:hypothetical protein
MLEMTIVVPMAITLMAGGVDFGMALSTQATLSKSVRDAARYLGNLPASAGCPGWAVTNATALVTPGATVSVDCSTPVAIVSAQLPYNSIIVGTFCASINQTNCTTLSAFTLSAQHEERQVGG